MLLERLKTMTDLVVYTSRDLNKEQQSAFSVSESHLALVLVNETRNENGVANAAKLPTARQQIILKC